MKTYRVLILLIGLIFCSGTALATTYKSDVDQDYGFYRVTSMDVNMSVNYMNKTLNITVGDEVVWINDATPDEPLTIISEQGLWENRSAHLRWNYQRFNYTFTEPGTYTFYIQQYPRKQHQVIMVEPTETSAPLEKVIVDTTRETPTETPISTPTIIPTETSTNKIPGFEIIMSMTMILFILYIMRR